jgi:hypothetical protein
VPQPQENGDKEMKALTVMIFGVLFVACYALTALVTMVAVGMIHAQWLHTMPTMGYHTALALAWIPGFFIAGAASSANPKN